MQEGDLIQVMEIERACFLSPWSEKMFLEELGNPLSRCLVAESCSGMSKELLGYICAWFVASEVHLMNLATHPKARGRGIAKDLIQEVVEQARISRALRVILEVRESNLAAQSLYSSKGFRKVGRRPRYYTDTGEDALLMELELGSGDESVPSKD